MQQITIESNAKHFSQQEAALRAHGVPKRLQLRCCICLYLFVCFLSLRVGRLLTCVVAAAQEQFEALCFEFGIELDDVVRFLRACVRVRVCVP